VIGARIDVSNLEFGYDALAPRVLEGLSLEVPSGSMTALLGPNGAGKTTLLYILLGWRAPQRGRVELDGNPIQSGPRLGAAIALVPQSEHVPFDFSLLEYVLLGRAPHLSIFGAPGERDLAVAREAIGGVGLHGLEQRYVPTLSGGQRQLAMVARALAQCPRLLLLDEPFSHLDLGNVARVAGILRRLSASGLTILFTTHDPNIVVELAGRVALLRDGHVVAHGSTREVMNSENLSATYGIDTEVLEVNGRHVVRSRVRFVASS
jgi:iron complex transport system ATP-binding protein